MPDTPLIPANVPIALVNTESERRRSDVGVVATRDHELIRRWAATHRAEPATGESTVSGQGNVDVNDGGAGIRFNFPAAGRFRPITWAEWLDHFEAHELVFVYQRDDPDSAPNGRYQLTTLDRLNTGPRIV